jgi:hypothetical protein
MASLIESTIYLFIFFNCRMAYSVMTMLYIRNPIYGGMRQSNECFIEG